MPTSTPLEQLRRADIESISFDFLEELIASSVEKQEDLDFKQTLYDNEKKNKEELIKDICAMANAGGGRLDHMRY